MWSTLSLFLFVTLTSNALLASESGSQSGYDMIIKELSTSDSRLEPTPEVWDEVMIHVGAGVGFAIINFIDKGDRSRTSNPFGFQIGLGIDLFDPHWVAEGQLRNFTSGARDERVQLREFELRLIHRTNPRSSFGFRFGLGVAGRYLDVEEGTRKAANDSSATTENKVTSLSEKTPSGSFMTGFESSLSKQFSVGSDVSFKTPLVRTSAERSSVDVTFRVEANF